MVAVVGSQMSGAVEFEMSMNPQIDTAGENVASVVAGRGVDFGVDFGAAAIVAAAEVPD